MAAPTLESWLPAAKEANPTVPEESLTAYWEQKYGPAPSSLPSLQTWLPDARKANPNVGDSDLISYWQNKYGAHGAPEKESTEGDGTRGFKDTFRQLPQLGYGLVAGAGATAESVLGEGGLATGLKKFGVEKFQEKSKEIASHSKPSDSFNYAYDQASQGNFGALVDWMQYGLGYAGGQGLQALATIPIGGAVGKAALQPIALSAAERLVAKEAARLATTDAAKTLGQEELKRLATANVAANIGKTVALGAQAVGMEGGEIFGDLATQSAEENRALTGEELAKAFGASLGAGALEFVGDKVGLDLVLGKSPVGKLAGSMPGTAGRVARAGVAGTAGAATEGATEFAQTLLEEVGKGKDPLSDVSIREAIDAAAMGAVGGGAMGGAGGMLSRAQQAPLSLPQPAKDTLDVQATTDAIGLGNPQIGLDEAIAAATSILEAPVGSDRKQADDLSTRLATRMDVQAGRLPTAQEAAMLSGAIPQARPEIPILPGAPAAPAPEGIQIVSPPSKPPVSLDDPRAAIAEERKRLLAMKESLPFKAKDLDKAPEVSAPVPDEPLRSSLDLAYTSTADINRLAQERGVEPGVIQAMVQQTTGKPYLSSLTPVERDRFNTVLQNMPLVAAGTKPVRKLTGTPTAPAQPAATEPVAPVEMTTRPRSELIPEQSTEMLLRAEKAQADLEIGTDDGPSLTDFIKSHGGLQDQGGELSHLGLDQDRKPFAKKLAQEGGLSLDRAAELAHESGYIPERDINLLLDKLADESRGHGSQSPGWYKDLVSGSNPLIRGDKKKTAKEKIAEAVAKIIKDDGVDVGSAVEKVKAAILADQEFHGTEWGRDLQSVLEGDWPSWIPKPEGIDAPPAPAAPEAPSLEVPTQVQKEKAKLAEMRAGGQFSDVASGAMSIPPPRIDTQAHEAAPSPLNDRPEPTDAQKEAGNYKKGHIRINGLDISVENPQGATRSGTDANGKPWSIEMKSHYGYIKGTKGKDKEHIDVFVKPGTPEDYSGPVFVVDQKKPNGHFDEHKVILGAGSQAEAEQLYKENYAKDWDGIRSVGTFESMDAFKGWLEFGDTTKPTGTKPSVQAEKDKLAAMKKPQQQEIPVPPPTIGERPIIAPEAPLSETPLFSKGAQEPEPEQTTLEDAQDDEPAKPLTDADIEKAFKRSSHSMADAKDRWDERRAKGLTDADLAEALGYEFGRGGFNADNLRVEQYGPKNPRLEINGTKTLQGKELLDLARKVLNIGTPAQEKPKAEGPDFQLPDDASSTVVPVTDKHEKLAGRKYKGYASTNEGGFLSVHAYGDTADEARTNVRRLLAEKLKERAEKRGEKRPTEDSPDERSDSDIAKAYFEDIKATKETYYKALGKHGSLMRKARTRGKGEFVKTLTPEQAAAIQNGTGLTPAAFWKFIQDNKNAPDPSVFDPKPEYTAPPKQEAPTPPPAAPTDKAAAAKELAEGVVQALKVGTLMNNYNFFEAADKVFGGTRASGAYTEKEAYDALELGVNLFLLRHAKEGVQDGTFDGSASLAKARLGVQYIRTRILERIPTQKPNRTEDQNEFQQFSTPPDLAYVMNWAANVTSADTMLEPSAGIGGIAVFAKLAGARVVMNEYHGPRADVLRQLDIGPVYQENAEQLNNILPDSTRPTVIVMNPPFSSTAGRKQGERSSRNVLRHLDQALARLEPGGRLVALIGQGRDGKDAQFLEEWKRLTGMKYAYRGRIGLSGEGYKKYGTTYNNQILIFDKIKPDGRAPVNANVADVYEALPLLSEVRDARTAPDRRAQSASTQSGSETMAQEGGRGDGSQPAVSPAAPTVGPRGERPGADAGQSPRAESAAAADRDQPPAQPGQGGGASVSPARPGGASGRPATPEPAQSGERAEPGGRSDASPGQPERSGQRGPDAGPGLSDRLTVEQGEEPEPAAPVDRTESDDSIFESYAPKKVRIKGAQPHPGKLVESSAMSAIDPPNATYKPSLPKDAIEEGRLSGAQLEPIVYAGQAHEQLLPDGSRRGFFDGDGTGVGKGREIAGIILDNLRQGHKKAVWMSKNSDLFSSAVRDWRAVSGTDGKELFSQGDMDLGETVTRKNGIMFSNYLLLGDGLDLSVDGKLEMKKHKEGAVDRKGNLKKPTTQTRLDQMVKWLGPDFDGVIVFDEAHEMRNNMQTSGARGDKKPAMKALAGIELQKRFPKARIAYFSATGGIEVSDFGYAERLGMWGNGTPFANKLRFVGEIQSGGLAAMELVSQDLKANGLYVSRSLSYDDVTYDRLEHVLTADQREMYDEMAKGWQIALQHLEHIMQVTGADKNGGAKSSARSLFWGTHQRFYEQVLTSLQMPTVIKAMEKDLAAGHSVVIQLTKTNAAQQDRQIKIKKQEGADLDDLDLTPREGFLSYIEHGFPTQEFQEYTDENGNVRSQPVFDSNGAPVQNKEAVEMKEELLRRLGSMRTPENPLDLIINTFGDKTVAEVTGRKQRLVRSTDRNGKTTSTHQTGRTKTVRNKEAAEFMDDKRQVLVFSDAGGTGQSYHADLAAKNQRRRMHYVIQPGWRADAAMQGLGRTHRTNQASAPHYVLVSTDLKGHKRFISTIARRLAQLGALTRGQRQTSSQGLFSEADNLENAYAASSLEAFFRALKRGDIKGHGWQDLTEKLGLNNLLDKNGNIIQDKLPDVPQFLNRILSLEYDDQNAVFDAFFDRMEAAIEMAKANGNFDSGMENYHADSITKQKEQVVYENPETKAKTRLITFEAKHRLEFREYKGLKGHQKFHGFVIGQKTGKIYAALKGGYQHTNKDGKVEEQVKLLEPDVDKVRMVSLDTFTKNYRAVTGKDAEKAWKDAIEKSPKTRNETLHILSGAMLGIWDRIGGSTRVYRVTTDDGGRTVGRVIDEDALRPTLERLGVKAEKADAPSLDKALDALENGGTVELANGWKLGVRRVNGEDRIEIMGSGVYGFREELKGYGAFVESIRYEPRVFIPTENPKPIIEKIIKHRPILRITGNGPDKGPGGGGSGPSFQRREGTPRLGASEMRALAGRIDAGDTEIVVAPFDALPDRIKEEAAKLGAPADEIRAVYDQGTVYLVEDRFESEADAEEAVFHELYHKWIAGHLGSSMQADLNAIFNRLGGPEAVLNLADKYQWREARAVMQSYAKRTDLSRQEKTASVVNELLAEMGSRSINPTALQKIKAFIGAIRQWLRDHGLASLSKITESDLLHLLQRARSTHGELKETGDKPYFQVGGSSTKHRGDAFTRWFGNSKVVNEDGSPMVVYHATPNDFEAFRPGGDDEGKSGHAIWFGTDPMNPQAAHNVLVGHRVGKFKEGVRTIPAYVKIERPLIIDDDTREWAQSIYGKDVPYLLRKPMVDKIMGDGYDGVMLYSRADKAPSGKVFTPSKLVEVIAFQPNQIKSAIGNRGTFDPDSSNILFQRRTADTQTDLPTISTRPDVPATIRGSQGSLLTTQGAIAYELPAMSKMDDVIRTLQDKNIDLARLVDTIKATGKTVADDLNPVLKEELYLGRVSKLNQDFLTDELRPLVDAMRLNKISMAQLDEYLYARHAKEANAHLKEINPDREDNDALSGMTDEEADRILDDNASPALERLTARVDAILEKTRAQLVAYGLESQETVDAWRDEYDFYVPLHREGYEDGTPGTGQGRSVRGPHSKARTGSTLKATNILANIAMDREKAIVRGEKMRPVIALAGLLQEHPNSDIATLAKPAPIIYTDPDTGLLTQAPGDIGEYRVPMVKSISKQTGLVEWRPDPTYKGRDNVVNFRLGGVDHAIVFNEHNDRAVQMARALKDLDVGQLNTILATVAPATRHLAAINTQYNPVFGVVNFIRDVQFAMLTLSTTPLANKRQEVLSATRKAIRGIYQDARAIRRGEHPSSAVAQLWERFQRVGGPTGYRDLFRSSNDRAAAIEHMLDPDWWTKTLGGKIVTLGGRLTGIETAIIDKAARPVFEWLSDYNQAMENAVRLGVFQTAIDGGMSDEKAASLAKNITVNFNKKGQITTQLGALYAFFNASVQGTARIAETLFEKGKFGVLTETGKTIIKGGVLIGAMQAFALSMAGFDDGEPPEWLKARSLIIPVPGTEKGYISIPMPLGFNVLPSLGRLATESLIYGKPFDRLYQFAGTVMDAFSPVGGASSIGQLLAPTATDPFVALSENRDWAGRQIYREDFNKLQPTPGMSRAKDTSTPWARGLAEAINWVTGGTEYQPGHFSPSPDAIDYLIEQATGGVGRELSKASQVASGLATGDEVPLHKVPLLGRLVGSASDAGSTRNQFYDNLREINLHEAEVKGRRRNQEDAAGYVQEHPEARLVDYANQVEREVSALNRRRRDLVRRGASAEQLRVLDMHISARMDRFNQRVKQLQDQ